MQAGYRLVSYADRRGARAGILAGGRVVDAAEILGADFLTVVAILQAWDEMHPRIAKAAADSGFATKGIPVSDVRLLAPVLYPGAFFCAGANYWDHLEEMAEIAKRTTGKAPSMQKAADPYFFMKNTAGGIIGTNTPARLPSAPDVPTCPAGWASRPGGSSTTSRSGTGTRSTCCPGGTPRARPR